MKKALITLFLFLILPLAILGDSTIKNLPLSTGLLSSSYLVAVDNPGGTETFQASLAQVMGLGSAIFQPAGDHQTTFNATQTVNWANGATQEITLTANITSLTFSNWVNGQSYRLVLIQGGSGSYTVAWPSVKWMGGTAPTLTTTVGAADIVTFVYGNSTIYGAATLNFQ
jgi:hypothetical protein